MRELTSHKVNGVNDGLTVMVNDEPGHGGACHNYQIELPPKVGGPADFPVVDIPFQNGPITEVGVNGVTHEALLAILIDRMEGFQGGQYKHAKNQEALEHCRGAMEALLSRTKERQARGVEGTHKV